MRFSSAKTLPFAACLLLLAVDSRAIAQANAETDMQRGVCARVKIRISQRVVLVRGAFRATLEIANAPQNSALEDVVLGLDIRNDEGEQANNRFGIRGPEFEGLDNSDAKLQLAPGSAARAEWTIVPAREAARGVPTRYRVGGSIAYREGEGEEVHLPFLPTTILVRPAPELKLHYFLPRQVYGDDPFTPQIEKAVPYCLGVILFNQGQGAAEQMKLTSSQPRIIENEKGLLVDFKILETRLNGKPAVPSFAAELGRIGPSDSAVVVWKMKSSLQGEFVDFDADFEHSDDLGNRSVSIIDQLQEHELAHVVRIDGPNDDGRPDFLTNEIDDPQHTPDTVFRSDASSAPVNAPPCVLSKPGDDDSLEFVIRGTSPPGFIYLQTESPVGDGFVLRRVVRSDGKQILRENFWTTSRVLRLVGRDDVEENKVHLFDESPSSNFEYKLVYGNNSASGDLAGSLPPPALMKALHPGEDAGKRIVLRIQWRPEADAGEHASTRWQVSKSRGFSETLLDVEDSRELVKFPIPSDALAADGTYFWRAQVKDSAGRKSPWAAPRQFTVRLGADGRPAGTDPRQAGGNSLLLISAATVIVLLVGTGLLVGAGLLVMRRRKARHSTR